MTYIHGGFRNVGTVPGAAKDTRQQARASSEHSLAAGDVVVQSRKVRSDLWKRVKRRLDAIDAASDPADLQVPGFDFHDLRGTPKRYSIHVNGPFCITFEWIEGDAWRVDL